MPNLTIYLPEDVVEKARALAKTSGASVNRWISSQIATTVHRSWSPGFLAAGGADPDFPEFQEPAYGPDGARELL